MDRTSIELELTAHLSAVAAARGKSSGHIELDRPFFETGVLDSLSLLDFVSFVEKRYDIDISGRDIVPENFGSLRTVTDYVLARLPQAAQQQ
jgi:acyl carrier protein